MEKSLSAKAALTVVLAEMVNVQVAEELVHPPLNPLELDPEAGAAVKVTLVPEAKEAEQTVPQLIPAGLEVTVPVPVPDFVTVAVKGVVPTGLMSKVAYQSDCRPPANACRPPKFPAVSAVSVTEMVGVGSLLKYTDSAEPCTTSRKW